MLQLSLGLLQGEFPNMLLGLSINSSFYRDNEGPLYPPAFEPMMIPIHNAEVKEDLSSDE